jgi:hypothetical protein
MPKTRIPPEVELQRISKSLERLHRRLKRTINAVDKLERRRKRLCRPVALPRLTPEEARIEQLAAKYEEPAPMTQSESPRVTKTQSESPRVASTPPADLDIPTFLQRKRDGEERDRIASEAILQEQAERKRNKAKARAEEAKAKKSGAATRMPLQGKAALDAIAQGVV